ncbi:polysaccharide biosynthesis/export family protein [Teichococcus oryzae]|uniref:Polysialic acid transport protein KpsD n=1 Tax=Teichococcus oryzae TaxID=1608942 RepID=A0A5B2TGR0_9PROT|nr:polysaccharide biosynthesis/export family protein [Pseudoroseomonas oryzae]KAA2213662.1 polysialic acid transport protein KpsD [Pseudoroseomonas oryzae]
MHSSRGLIAAALSLLLAGQAAAQNLNAPVPGLMQQQMQGQGLPGQQQVPSLSGQRQVPQLLPQDNIVNRAGSTTEAEAGATAEGPLAEPYRPAGPSRTVFGAQLFTRGAPAGSESANPNYRLGPGDRVSVRVWGPVESEVIGAIDPEGNLFLPSIGPLRLAGLRAGDLQRTVEGEVRRIYTQQVQVYAVLLSASQIGVYVTGFVRTPGRHLGSGSETVLDYLLRAGGVDPVRGSYRDIVVNRGGRAVVRIDLYPFLLQGKLPQLTLQDGDTIVVGKQGAVVSADGAVRNNFLFEVAGRAMAGQELNQLAAPLPAATNAVIRGTRNGQPWSRYVDVATLEKQSLLDQDVVTFITDSPAPTVRVFVEGSRLGPSVLVADRDIDLCSLLDHVAVDPALADTDSVFILRKRIAAQQRRAINEALDRLERQLFTATSATTGIAQIRSAEAQMVSNYIQRGRRIEPEGRLVAVDSNGRCSRVRLEDGDTIVIPERSDTILVAGEVMTPQAVLWRPNMTIDEYVEEAGGYTQRGNSGGIMIRRASGQIILDPRQGPRPGDELIVLPQLGVKGFQLASDLLAMIYQAALAVRYFDIGR